jgi:hypothetical protein
MLKDRIWLVNPATRELVTPYQLLPGGQKIVAAQPFTVSLINVVLSKNYESIFRGDNDILISTKSAFGEQPLVDRIHYYEEGVPKGEPIGNILSNTVFVTDDYNGEDKLWLELDVTEVDTDSGERKAAVAAFSTLASTAGAIFPVALPYAFAATALVNVFEKLLSALERDTPVIRAPFALYSGELSLGKAPLQKGTYVCFETPQFSTGFRLEENGLVVVGEEISPTREFSYAVFDIVPKKQVSPAFVISQKMATLLTQMKKGGSSPTLTIEFLTDTLTQYSNFKKLTRYVELKGKSSLTDEEKSLMAGIANIDILKPFLPKS